MVRKSAILLKWEGLGDTVTYLKFLALFRLDQSHDK